MDTVSTNEGFEDCVMDRLIGLASLGLHNSRLRRGFHDTLTFLESVAETGSPRGKERERGEVFFRGTSSRSGYPKDETSNLRNLTPRLKPPEVSSVPV